MYEFVLLPHKSIIMGQQNAKPQSKQVKAAKATVVASQVQQTTAKMQYVQAAAVQALAAQQQPAMAGGGVGPTSTALINPQTKMLQDVLQATMVGEAQLNRGGAAFTKPDLVAILLCLEPSMMTHRDSVNALSCEDIRTKIRLIIFDPHRYMGAGAAGADASVAPTMETDDLHYTSVDSHVDGGGSSSSVIYAPGPAASSALVPRALPAPAPSRPAPSMGDVGTTMVTRSMAPMPAAPRPSPVKAGGGGSAELPAAFLTIFGGVPPPAMPTSRAPPQRAMLGY